MDFLNNLKNSLLGMPRNFQGDIKLRDILMRDDALFHTIGKIDAPNIFEKILSIKSHGLVSLARGKTELDKEQIQGMEQQQAKDLFRLNLNGAEYISTFNYNAAIQDYRKAEHKRRIDQGSQYYGNYSGHPDVTFKIKKDGLCIERRDTGSFSVPGECFVKDKIPVENIIGVVIPDAGTMTAEQKETAKKKLLELFTNAEWTMDFYSGVTGELLGSNRQEITRRQNATQQIDR